MNDSIIFYAARSPITKLGGAFKNKAAPPKTMSKFAILLPTTLPQAKSGEFFNTAFIETTNSGADVPNATIVTAIKWAGKFKEFAVLIVPFTSILPP